MSRGTDTTPGGASSPRRNDRGGGSAAVAVPAQVGVLFVTAVTGVLGVFVAENAWFLALAQAAVGAGLVIWLAVRRHGRATLIVPLVSFALTLGLVAVSGTVAVACSDRALAAFERVPPPPGVSLEIFVSPSQGCMAETTPARIPQTDVFAHYRSEFREQGWRIDSSEGLWAERNDVYVNMYNAEGHILFILGRCGEWGTRCLAERGR